MPLYDNELGHVVLEYKGGVGGCHGSYTRTTHIDFQCVSNYSEVSSYLSFSLSFAAPLKCVFVPDPVAGH